MCSSPSSVRATSFNTSCGRLCTTFHIQTQNLPTDMFEHLSARKLRLFRYHLALIRAQKIAVYCPCNDLYNQNRDTADLKCVRLPPSIGVKVVDPNVFCITGDSVRANFKTLDAPSWISSIRKFIPTSIVSKSISVVFQVV